MSALVTDEKRASSDYDDRKVAHDSLTGRPAIAATAEEEAAKGGVKRVEGAFKVFGKNTRWFLFLGFVPSSSTFHPSLPSYTTSPYLKHLLTPLLESHSQLSSMPSIVAPATIILLSPHPLLSSTRFLVPSQPLKESSVCLFLQLI
jgi:hypothetical protein